MVGLPPLCAPVDIRALTNVSPGYQGWDKSFETFIGTVSSQVRTFCRREFNKRERIETFASRNDFYELWTKECPIDPAAPIELLYSPIGDFRLGAAYIVPAADFTVDHEHGAITINASGFENSRKGLRLRYTGGYPTIQADAFEICDVPEEVRRATAMQCAVLINKVKATALGKTSIAQGQQGVTENFDRGGITGLIREVTGALVSYRRALVGRT